ncbi:protein SOGA3-like isoform X5 [Gopherus flavomarginatus]|nr:protein SOGA3-like isoform X5 [Gopherus flavomarginatus]
MVTKGPGCGAAPLTQRRVPASCCPSRARWALREPPPPPPDSEQPPLGEEGARLRRRPGWGTGGGGGAAGGSSARRGGVRSQPGYLRAARGSGRLSAQVRAQEPRSSLSLEICTAMKQPCIPSLNRLSTNQLQV